MYNSGCYACKYFQDSNPYLKCAVNTDSIDRREGCREWEQREEPIAPNPREDLQSIVRMVEAAEGREIVCPRSSPFVAIVNDPAEIQRRQELLRGIAKTIGDRVVIGNQVVGRSLDEFVPRLPIDEIEDEIEISIADAWLQFKRSAIELVRVILRRFRRS